MTALMAAASLGVVLSVRAQTFYPDDPLRVDDDKLDTPTRPAAIELSDLYDRFGHIFKDLGASEHGSEAANVNTLDEVPESSWFTNRHGKRRLSLAELVRGPDSGDGPDPKGTWTVFKSKSQGLTPGFEVRDSKGDRYIIKLDPIGIPELSSAAEVIATKIFHAMGYNVAENYIVHFKGEMVIAPGTTVEDRFGDEMPLTDWRFRRMIRRVPRLADGSIRVTASKYIPGAPIGPFRYHGTRSDDPNDVIAHEDRRELRGLRLLAAWLNHDDTRSHNTQDSWVEEGGLHYVRHYLLDFGSTFGSGSIDMQYPNLSFQYWLDPGSVKKNAYSFGVAVPEYRKVEWPDFPEYESVGRWEGEAFDPAGWRNDYPNPAFVRMTARDAFWAAKILMAFTHEELEAIVATGHYTNPVQSAYFLDVLLERQKKCGRLGINALNPLDGFRVEQEQLLFENLSESYGFTSSGTRYEVSWSAFDNESGTTTPLTVASTYDVRRIPLPELGAGRAMLCADVASLNSEFPHWKRSVRVYLRPSETGYEVVGLQRESPTPNLYPME